MTLPYNRQVFASGAPTEPSTCAKFDSNPTKDGCVPHFDLAGDALPTANAPTGAVTVKATDNNSVTFNFPSVTANDSLSIGVGGSQNNIAVTSGKYSELDLLAAAGNGPAGLSFTFKYSDGSTSTQTLSVPDWYKNTPAFAIKIGGRWVPGATAVATGNLGLYALSVAVDGSKTLSSFSINDTDKAAAAGANENTAVANILAATLEPAAVAPASSASSSSSSSSSLPKTGGADTLFLGGILLAVGAAVTIKGRRR